MHMLRIAAFTLAGLIVTAQASAQHEIQRRARAAADGDALVDRPLERARRLVQRGLGGRARRRARRQFVAGRQRRDQEDGKKSVSHA